MQLLGLPNGANAPLTLGLPNGANAPLTLC